MWNETHGNCISSAIATCVIDHLKNVHAKMPDIHHIIIYSAKIICRVGQCIIHIFQIYIISGHKQMTFAATHSYKAYKGIVKSPYAPTSTLFTLWLIFIFLKIFLKQCVIYNIHNKYHNRSVFVTPLALNLYREL